MLTLTESTLCFMLRDTYIINEYALNISNAKKEPEPGYEVLQDEVQNKLKLNKILSLGDLNARIGNIPKGTLHFPMSKKIPSYYE